VKKINPKKDTPNVKNINSKRAVSNVKDNNSKRAVSGAQDNNSKRTTVSGAKDNNSKRTTVSGAKDKNSKRVTANVKNINIGIVIILLAFVYIIIYVVSGLTKDHLSIYEVQAISMSKDNNAEAVIVRDEEDCYAETSGYTNYYVRSGSRVAVGDTIYSIDESKNVYEYLVDYDLNYSFSEDDINILKSYISSFVYSYDQSDYSMVYDLKEDITSEVSNISDTYLLDNLNDILDESDNKSTFNVITSSVAGSVSFFSDSLDGLTAEEVDTSTFNKDNYSSKNLYETDLKEKGSLVYKLITNDSWTLIINLTQEQYENLKDKTSISFTITDDSLYLTKNCSFYTTATGYFCKIEMSDYLVRYIKDRFLSIQLDLDVDEGLKIPYSAITSKEFYTIPAQYYIYNEETDSYGFTIMDYDITQDARTYQFIEADSYYDDEDNNLVYIDTDVFDYGQYIYSMEDETLFQVSVVKSLQGVYNVNKGYAVFKRIEISSEGEDYCIVKSGESHSLSAHDHIALHADLISENVQIY
jgi:hypothetical protein